MNVDSDLCIMVEKTKGAATTFSLPLLLFFFEDISLVFNDWGFCLFHFSVKPILRAGFLFNETVSFNCLSFNHLKPLKLPLSISWRLAIRSGSP